MSSAPLSWLVQGWGDDAVGGLHANCASRLNGAKVLRRCEAEGYGALRNVCS